MTYSEDLRERVLRALERGERPVEIARRFEVSRAWVYQIKERFDKYGERSARQVGGYRISKADAAKDDIFAWIAQEPDLTLEDLVTRLHERRAISMRVHALWHRLNKWGLTFKKNASRKRTKASGRARGARPVATKPTRNAQRTARLSG